MQKRKRRYTFYANTRMPGIGKGKDAELGLCQDGSGTNKMGEAKWDRGSR